MTAQSKHALHEAHKMRSRNIWAMLVNAITMPPPAVRPMWVVVLPKNMCNPSRRKSHSIDAISPIFPPANQVPCIIQTHSHAICKIQTIHTGEASGWSVFVLSYPWLDAVGLASSTAEGAVAFITKHSIWNASVDAATEMLRQPLQLAGWSGQPGLPPGCVCVWGGLLQQSRALAAVTTAAGCRPINRHQAYTYQAATRKAGKHLSTVGRCSAAGAALVIHVVVGARLLLLAVLDRLHLVDARPVVGGIPAESDS